MFDVVLDSGDPDVRAQPGAAITVGTFDGVHLGHRAVIRVLNEQARESGLESLVVTFEPHPLQIVRPEAAPPLLTTTEEKRDRLLETGVDRVVFLRFSPALAALSAREFVERILVDRFNLQHLIVGHDHGLGRGRSGDVDALRGFGAELGFAVDAVKAVVIDGEAVSSTRIRQALADADLRAASRGLGRAYSARGMVVRGEGEGRDLGFPTANLRIDDSHKLLPKEGVYAARATLDDGERVAGALHLGPRPTYQDRPPSVELHIFDFDRQIYGRTIEIEFCGWVREIQAFGSEKELIAAMHADTARARTLLQRAEGACEGAL